MRGLHVLHAISPRDVDLVSGRPDARVSNRSSQASKLYSQNRMTVSRAATQLLSYREISAIYSVVAKHCSCQGLIQFWWNPSCFGFGSHMCLEMAAQMVSAIVPAFAAQDRARWKADWEVNISEMCLPLHSPCTRDSSPSWLRRCRLMCPFCLNVLSQRGQL